MPIEYLAQGVDFLGTLNAKLRDLRGWSTLLYELVQNADDAAGATSLTIHVNSDALIVENDGEFSDCGRAGHATCAWSTEGGGRRRCDFHAFRLVASGHKRVEEGTTGAFGIGFTAVYQITDHPELQAGQWHWQLHPEAEESRRIWVLESKGTFKGTRFVFPWARLETELRTRLGVEPVPSSIDVDIVSELERACILAAPFLKRLSALRLYAKGHRRLAISCSRDPDASDLLVEVESSGNRSTRLWRTFTGDFSAERVDLKKRFGNAIEDKRSSFVTLAVPQDASESSAGLLYATLPTAHEIDVPVLINADFYPSTDRKKILFDADYQGEWNRAAIRCAARTMATNLVHVRDLMQVPGDFWGLVKAVNDMDVATRNGKVDKVFGEFWHLVSEILRTGSFVWDSRGNWSKPVEVAQLPSVGEDESVIPLLHELNVSVVHPDLRGYTNLLRDSAVGVKYLSAEDLATAMERQGLTEIRSPSEMPTWLRSRENRTFFGELIQRYVARLAREIKPGAERRIGHCAIALRSDGSFAPPSRLFSSDDSTRTIFSRVSPGLGWIHPREPGSVLRFARAFELSEAISVLESVDGATIKAAADADKSWLAELIQWFATRRSQLDGIPALASRLRALPIWRSGQGLFPLTEVAVPGGFDDPLGLAIVLDPVLASRFGTFLIEDLAAAPLTFTSYLTLHVTRELTSSSPPTSLVRERLFELIARKLGEIRDNDQLMARLGALPIIKCADGKFRAARETHMPTRTNLLILGPESATLVSDAWTKRPSATELLLAIGARNGPSGEQAIQRVKDLTGGANSPEIRAKLAELVEGLAALFAELGPAERAEFTGLRELRWMPAIGKEAWYQPAQLFVQARDYLFESQARFVNLPTRLQQRSAEFLKFLNVRAEPDVSLVVAHLLHCANNNLGVNPQVYEFLDQNHEEGAVAGLVGRACLHEGDGRYLKPEDCFWSSHPFGAYRVTLQPEWRRFSRLLARLQVKEAPTAEDALSVLSELSKSYWDHRIVSLPDQAVANQCWSFLGGLGDLALEDHAVALGFSAALNHRGFFKRPAELIFDDRPGVIEKFGGDLESHVIQLSEPSATALRVAGVRALSELLAVDLVDCEGVGDAQVEGQRLADRWPLVRRIFAAAHVKTDMDRAPAVQSAELLRVVYRINRFASVAEAVDAYLDRQQALIYFDRRSLLKWTHIAREVCSLAAGGEAALLASAIKDALQPESIDEAVATLDALGVPRVLEDQAADLDSSRTMQAPQVPYEGVTSSDSGSVRDWGALETWQNADGPLKADVLPALQHLALGPDEPIFEKERGIEHFSALAGSQNRISAAESQDSEGRAEDEPMPASDEPRKRPKPLVRPKVQPRPVLRSFLSADSDDESSLSKEEKERRRETDRAGISHVLEFERREGRFPEEMPHENEGYDIESFDASGEMVRYIEVKSLSGAWDGYNVKVTPAQFKKAQRELHDFWLYVVEHAGSEAPQLHRIQNPAGNVTEFRFDDGWTCVEEVLPIRTTRISEDASGGAGIPPDRESATRAWNGKA